VLALFCKIPIKIRIIVKNQELLGRLGKKVQSGYLGLKMPLFLNVRAKNVGM
jgi:hypothetical protein